MLRKPFVSRSTRWRLQVFILFHLISFSFTFAIWSIHELFPASSSRSPIMGDNEWCTITWPFPLQQFLSRWPANPLSLTLLLLLLLCRISHLIFIFVKHGRTHGYRLKPDPGSMHYMSVPKWRTKYGSLIPSLLTRNQLISIWLLHRTLSFALELMVVSTEAWGEEQLNKRFQQGIEKKTAAAATVEQPRLHQYI